jgi:breast cancer 2 susceptibility protein
LQSYKKWECELSSGTADISPDEIWQLDLSNALTYQFIADDASLLTNITAFHTLKRDGCALVTQKWVDNHYVMILWKLAGQIPARPELFNERWKWSEVIEQLKYR